MEDVIVHFAGILLLTDKNELILQQRDHNPSITNPGKITIFGGTLEKNERPIEAVKREVKEELNIDLENVELFKVYNKTKEVHGENAECYIFVSTILDINNMVLNEGEDIVYIKSDDDLNKFNLSILSKQILKDYFSL